LIDVVDANEDFDLAKFQKLAYKAIDNILKRGKLPIIAGGSGLYLQAIVDGYQLPDSKPDITLRKKQEIKKVSDLFLEINKLSPKLAQKINNSDRQNKRRLIRYLEILNSDKDIKIKSKKNRKYDALLIGLAPNREELKTKIKQRLISRLEKEAMIDEVKTLHQNGLSWKRLEEFGLEYKFISLFLQEKLKYEEMVEKLNIAIRQFAKRQMTWFRRWEKQGTKIIWLDKQDDLIKIIMQFKKG
jgi:tRNA dimethylallyltransferase